jgi:NAD(P)-dependent dehydrogenase (short-subunit alcohol dehydrogenase family)
VLPTFKVNIADVTGFSVRKATRQDRKNGASGLQQVFVLQDLRDSIVQRSPLGRIGRPDEIANAVSWLISPEASYVTGSDITVAGGL